MARSGKNVKLGPAAFVLQQILLLHPILFPLWAGGLVCSSGAAAAASGSSAGRTSSSRDAFRAEGKNYYLAPIYPVLFAAGAVALEATLQRYAPTRGRLWPKAVAVTVIVAAALVVAPLALPLLPPDRYVAYEKALGITPPRTEVAHRGPLPQIFGDQFGWPELVAEVAGIYHALPPEERARTGIFANNYGEAGAVALFGPRHGLPRPISGHQSYFSETRRLPGDSDRPPGRRESLEPCARPWSRRASTSIRGGWRRRTAPSSSAAGSRSRSWRCGHG